MQALKVARRANLKEFCPDFAGSIALSILEGKEPPKNLKRRVIDFKRKTFGDLRTPEGRARAAQHTVVGEDFESDEFNPESTDPNPVIERFAAALKSEKLTNGDRLLLWIKYGLGARNAEIGALLGVSDTRVSQLLRESEARFRGEKTNLGNGR
jgi:hypothetical protein